ncbi:MAG: J domain-containing protein [Chlamydiia bacterium]|nr:J domain-containing protein [Chlamydiia bacterium]
MSDKDYYRILGVSKNAKPEEIKKAYKILVAKKHPDKFGNTKESESEFRGIKKSYEVLSDPNKRSMYDKHGSSWEARSKAGPGFGGFDGFTNWGEDFFSSVFENFGGRRGAGGQARRGDDIELVMGITLEDVANGQSKDIKYERVKACSKCAGSGARSSSDIITCGYCNGSGQSAQNLGGMIFSSQCGSCGGSGRKISMACKSCAGQGATSVYESLVVNIPIGMPFGKRIKKAGMGSTIANGAPGDLYIRIVESKESSKFSRLENDKDLMIVMQIDMYDATIGGVKKVKSFMKDELDIDIKIPEGVDSMDTFSVRGKGMPILQGNGRRGDLYVRVKVSTPKQLSPKHKEMMKTMYEEDAFKLDNKKSWKEFIFG